MEKGVSCSQREKCTVGLGDHRSLVQGPGRGLDAVSVLSKESWGADGIELLSFGVP